MLIEKLKKFAIGRKTEGAGVEEGYRAGVAEVSLVYTGARVVVYPGC